MFSNGLPAIPNHFSFSSVYAGIYIGAMVAVFYTCCEHVLQPCFDSRIIEGAMLAIGGEIGVVTGKDGLALAGIVFQAGLGVVSRRRTVGHSGWNGGGGLVGGGEVALAVPAVAWAVTVPERVVDGKDGVPEGAVVLTGVGGRGG